MGKLDFRLLGAVEVHSDGAMIDLGRANTAKVRCLLAALLRNPGALVPTDTLLDRVWGPQPPSSAVRYKYIAWLRAALAPLGVAVDSRDNGYVLVVAAESVDAHRFERLAEQARRSAGAGRVQEAVETAGRALDLWRGPALSGLPGLWAHTYRDHLERRRRDTVATWATGMLTEGDPAVVADELAGWHTDHPTDEAIAAALMHALHGTGRTSDALACYHATQQHLQADLAAEPGPDLTALYHQLRSGTPATEALAPHPPALTPDDQQTKSTTTVPRQLPAAPARFSGRTSELAALSDILDTTAQACPTMAIAAITGTGGIGKTWLALHWAHQHLDEFPDGQLFIDLQGFAPVGKPLPRQVAVQHLLEGLGISPDRIPAVLSAQAALYRSTIAGKRMLIVLDNAADTAQITPLLPGSPTCTVLITSRRYLSSLITHHNTQPLRLDVLTEDEARTLLRARLGADRVAAEADAIAALLAWCGGLPLALGIVTGRALAHPNFALSVLAAEISDNTRTLVTLDDRDAAASLPAVVSWSVRALTTDQAQLFALLGLAPGPDIGLPAAASLADLPVDQTRAMLRELEHASLVQQHLPGRYRMHDLIRLYATHTAHHDLAPDMRETALQRVIDFYTHTAHTADHLLDPHRHPIPLSPPALGVRPHPLADLPAALAWFDTEHHNLLAAQHAAARNAWHITVWQLAWALNTFHYRHGHRHDRHTTWQAALDAAIHLPDPTPRIRAHRNLGDTYGEQGRYDDAIRHLHQSLTLAEHHDHVPEQAHTHWILAEVWEQRGDDRRALRHATHSLDLYRTLNLPIHEANLLNAVGWCAARLGEYDTARTHCQAALALHQHHNNPNSEAATLDSLGYIAYHTGQHRQAIDHYQQALILLRAHGNNSHAADTLDHLGHPHIALGEHEQARVVWQQALRLYQEQGRDTDAARVQQQLDTVNEQSTSDQSGGLLYRDST